VRKGWDVEQLNREREEKRRRVMGRGKVRPHRWSTVDRRSRNAEGKKNRGKNFLQKEGGELCRREEWNPDKTQKTQDL